MTKMIIRATKIAQNIILSNYVVKCPKLTNEQAKEIRELHKSGKYTHQQLADIYNVKRLVILNIVNNNTYIL